MVVVHDSAALSSSDTSWWYSIMYDRLFRLSSLLSTQHPLLFLSCNEHSIHSLSAPSKPTFIDYISAFHIPPLPTAIQILPSFPPHTAPIPTDVLALRATHLHPLILHNDRSAASISNSDPNPDRSSSPRSSQPRRGLYESPLRSWQSSTCRGLGGGGGRKSERGGRGKAGPGPDGRLGGKQGGVGGRGGDVAGEVEARAREERYC